MKANIDRILASDSCILSIESSCDDTAASIWKNGRILSNVVANQDVHKHYGGVVPELASRQHQSNIVPVIDIAIQKANITLDEIRAIACTRGPGLLGSLLVGVGFAKSMALSLGIPLIEVHHMRAHVLAHFIESPRPIFPFLCLTVSGGHTQIVRVDDFQNMTILGQTIDDAAGEAFDKAGKMLGLPYPAGPEIDRLAQRGKAVFEFTEPRVAGLDFSFSGLKTAILYFLRDRQAENPRFIAENLNDICASVQRRIVSILMRKLEMAAEQTNIRHIGIAGGVSANNALRQVFQRRANEKGWHSFIPAFEYCTDNAAMIAIAGHVKYVAGDYADQTMVPAARLGI